MLAESVSAEGALAHSARTVSELGELLPDVCIPRHARRSELRLLLEQQSAPICFAGLSLVPVVRSRTERTLLGAVPVSLVAAIYDGDAAPASRPTTAPPSRPPNARSRANELERGDFPKDLSRPLLEAGTERAATACPPRRNAVDEASGRDAKGGGAEAAPESPVDVLYDEGGELRPGADLAPLTISRNMRLARVCYLFRLLGTASACVTEEGEFVGSLTRLNLSQRLASLAEDHAEPPAHPTGGSPYRLSMSSL